jgi:hypothetical protein
MNSDINIDNMSLVELKALAYDLHAKRELTEKNIATVVTKMRQLVEKSKNQPTIEPPPPVTKTPVVNSPIPSETPAT